MLNVNTSLKEKYVWFSLKGMKYKVLSSFTEWIDKSTDLVNAKGYIECINIFLVM